MKQSRVNSIIYLVEKFNESLQLHSEIFHSANKF